MAFALGLSCLPILVIEPRLSPLTLFNETFKAYNSFILLAVPFFLLTANLMNVGGITDRLVRLSRTMVGNWPGSLAQINVLLSVFFAGSPDLPPRMRRARARSSSTHRSRRDMACRSRLRSPPCLRYSPSSFRHRF